MEERKLKFANQIAFYKDKYPRELLLSFYNYWTETNPNGRKMRFEKEKTFGLGQRLARFNMNQKQWNKPKKVVKESAATIIQRKYGITNI